MIATETWKTIVEQGNGLGHFLGKGGGQDGSRRIRFRL